MKALTHVTWLIQAVQKERTIATGFRFSDFKSWPNH